MRPRTYAIIATILLLVFVSVCTGIQMMTIVSSLFGYAMPMSSSQIERETSVIDRKQTLVKEVDGKMTAILYKTSDEVGLIVEYRTGILGIENGGSGRSFATTDMARDGDLSPDVSPVSVVVTPMNDYDVVGVTLNDPTLIGRVGRVDVRYRGGSILSVPVAADDMIIRWEVTNGRNPFSYERAMIYDTNGQLLYDYSLE